MKKKILLIGFTIYMFFINLTLVNAASFRPFLAARDATNTTECEQLFGHDTMELIRTAFTIMRWAVPILLIILVSMDFFSVITTGNPDAELKKITQKSIKRAVIALIIFLFPDLLNFFLTLINSSTCGLG